MNLEQVESYLRLALDCVEVPHTVELGQDGYIHSWRLERVVWKEAHEDWWNKDQSEWTEGTAPYATKEDALAVYLDKEVNDLIRAIDRVARAKSD